MNANLKKMTQEWMQLERKTLKQRQEADSFYEKNLMKLIEQDYQKRNKGKLIGKAEYLIMSVGTSFEPLVLNISLMKPKRILFLYTDISEKTLAKIVDYCRLAADQYEKSRVDESDPLTIYREIKESYLVWGKPARIYIDFTGGTKSMAAAAAMAGALIDVQLVYVGSDDYLTDFRKPNPGSEQLLYIDNPISVFGDLEIGKAMTLFEQCNYAGAREKLSYLKENVPEPDMRQQLDFAYQLAVAYEAWDALDFPRAGEAMRALNSRMQRDSRTHANFLMMDYRERLTDQEILLNQLGRIPALIKDKRQKDILQDKNLMTALMFTMYQNAQVREQQEKYDMASLLMYRLLEMIEQRRLAEYNLYVSRMDYSALDYSKIQLDGKIDLERIRENMNRIREGMFGKQTNRYLPDQISLLDGYMLLLALGDAISKVPNGRDLDFLRRLRSMVYLRNNSIFAHGLGPVGPADYRRFKDFVEEVFAKYCRIEEIDMETLTDIMQWKSPIHSQYYAHLGQ